MISQRVKDWYWLITSPVCWLNLQLKKIQWRYLSGQEGLLLNIGSGEEYVDGFLNIEGNVASKKDLWLNLNQGLPFRAGQVRGIYLSHVLEHFPVEEAVALLRECHRTLSDGGGIRIVVPSLEKAVAAYSRRDSEWFSSFPDHFESIGGRFFNYMMCRDQHRLLLDQSFVEELARSARFSRITGGEYGQSSVFSDSDLGRLEPVRRREFCQNSLIVEAFK